MTLVQCPECLSRISSSAKTCPYCGYVGEDEALAICRQEGYEIAPRFRFRTKGQWLAGITSFTLSPSENKQFVDYFCDWENICQAAPAIAEGVKGMLNVETTYVAKMTPEIKRLMAEGKLTFQFDKDGEIMAILKDTASSKWRKQVRLEEMRANPDFGQSINNLTTIAYMNQILDRIENLSERVSEVRAEIRNDRYAKADAAKELLERAVSIDDSRLRMVALNDAIGRAAEAKCMLMRDCAYKLRSLRGAAEKKQWRSLTVGGKEVDVLGSDVFGDIEHVTLAAQVECYGYIALGELEAARMSALQLNGFIRDNRLDERDTLLLVNGALKNKQPKLIDSFLATTKDLKAFASNSLIDRPIERLMPPGDEVDGRGGEWR